MTRLVKRLASNARLDNISGFLRGGEAIGTERIDLPLTDLRYLLTVARAAEAVTDFEGRFGRWPEAHLNRLRAALEATE